MTERWMSLSELFDWEYEDPINLYPFEAKCLAVDWNPMDHPELMELGRPTIDFVFGRSSYPSRQIKAGLITLYMPERWLSVKEKPKLMQALVDLHETYPIKKVHIITGEPVIMTDFIGDMIRLERRYTE